MPVYRGRDMILTPEDCDCNPCAGQDPKIAVKYTPKGTRCERCGHQLRGLQDPWADMDPEQWEGPYWRDESGRPVRRPGA